jgi:hypothetical protein
MNEKTLKKTEISPGLARYLFKNKNASQNISANFSFIAVFHKNVIFNELLIICVIHVFIEQRATKKAPPPRSPHSAVQGMGH